MIKLKKYASLLLVMVLLLLPANVFASNGGSGGGSGGGGGNNPLTLESSNPSNLEVDVDPNIEMVLVFSNNIVAHAENNIPLVSLQDSNGNDVPVVVTMIPEDVDREQRERVYINSVSPLERGEQYKIVVQPGFKSKNGQTTKKVIEVTFTTLADEIVTYEPDGSGNVNIDEADVTADGQKIRIQLSNGNNKAVVAENVVTKMIEKGSLLNFSLENNEVSIPATNLVSGQDMEFEMTSLTSSEFPEGAEAVSGVYKFQLTQGNNKITSFSTPITLKLKVTSNDEVDTSKLKVMYYNESDKKWEDILNGGSYVNGFVVAQTDHFSTFAIFQANRVEDGEEKSPTPTVPTPGDDELNKGEETPSAETKEGNELPNTATNMFNILTIGVMFLLIGSVLLFVQRKKTA